MMQRGDASSHYSAFRMFACNDSSCMACNFSQRFLRSNSVGEANIATAQARSYAPVLRAAFAEETVAFFAAAAISMLRYGAAVYSGEFSCARRKAAASTKYADRALIANTVVQLLAQATFIAQIVTAARAALSNELATNHCKTRRNDSYILLASNYGRIALVHALRASAHVMAICGQGEAGLASSDCHHVRAYELLSREDKARSLRRLGALLSC